MRETMKHMRNITGILILVAADMLSLILAMLCAYGLRLLLNPLAFTPRFSQPMANYLTLFWVPVVGLFFLAVERMYDRRLLFWEEVARLVKGCLMGGAVILAFLTLTKRGIDYSRLLFLFYVCLTVVFLPIGRLFAKKLLYHVGIWKQYALVLGSGRHATTVARVLNREKYLGYCVVGFIQESDKPVQAESETIDGRQFPVHVSMEEALKANAERTVPLLVIAPDPPFENLKEMVTHAQALFASIMVAPDVVGLPLLNTEPLRLFEEQRLLLNIRNNLANPLNRFIKRSLDILMVLLLLPLWLPVMLILGILVKVSSKGTILYVQPRLGRNGRLFHMLKFRTMYRNADELLDVHLAENPQEREDWQTYRKLRKRDPRVTGVGRWIRRASLDELPQLLNVLLGHMSLTGPRPYMVDEKGTMGETASTILMARPGLTGLWQISGRNRLTFQDRIALDQWYVMNWTLWLDVEILVKTVRTVFRREGAY